jgi:hypothetical protein
MRPALQRGAAHASIACGRTSSKHPSSKSSSRARRLSRPMELVTDCELIVRFDLAYKPVSLSRVLSRLAQQSSTAGQP